ncbi:Hypothetical protein RAK1035_1364 [Roseovarius sp. AK1035]|nr:Hypothetical protein RAK1035_1364 [Roseovarius sp. AK1035]
MSGGGTGMTQAFFPVGHQSGDCGSGPRPKAGAILSKV